MFCCVIKPYTRNAAGLKRVLQSTSARLSAASTEEISACNLGDSWDIGLVPCHSAVDCEG